MRKMGFNEEWIYLIIMCITIVTYSFKLNGDPVGYIQPRRGIRQGDPLAPYLFVICAEGLSAMFAEWERKWQIKGVTIYKGAPSVNHLLFADDRFIFNQSSLQECQNVKRLLKIYEKASGQAINYEKSCVAFIRNLTEFDGQLIADCLGVSRVQYHDRYWDYRCL